MSARERIIPVFVPHWGCPHNCVFCNQRRITGEKKPAAALDVNEALKGNENENVQVAFYGGSFTAIPVKQQIELLSAAAGYPIRLSTRPDCIDEQTLLRLREYGVVTIELGAQSLDNGVLAQSGRGHTAEDVICSSEMIKNFGFRLILQMMTGLPGDSREKDIRTAEKIASLRPDGVRIYPTVIIKDTELFDMWKAGTYSEHTVEDAVDVCSEILPVFENAGIPIIRLGLNPTDDLSGGDAVAGAYHPALGELVRSRIRRNEIEALLEGENFCGRTVEIPVKSELISQYIGQKKCNISYFRERYGIEVKFTSLEKN